MTTCDSISRSPGRVNLPSSTGGYAQRLRCVPAGKELAALFAHLEKLSRTAGNKEYWCGYYQFRLFWEVLPNTGMRRRELLGLKMENVDFYRM